MSAFKLEYEKEKDQEKKSVFVIILEGLFLVTLLTAFVDLHWFNPDIVGLPQRLILPGILLGIRLFYAIPDIGIAFVATFAFLDGYGINGFPAFALILLVVLGIMNYTNSDKLWAELFKVIFGVTAGSFAQKIHVNYKKRDEQ